MPRPSPRRPTAKPPAIGAAEFRAAFTHAVDGMLLTRPDGGVLAANPAAQAILGYSEEELRTIGRAGVMDTADPRLAVGLRERERTGHFDGSLTMIRKGGERFEVELSSAIFTNGDGAPLAVICFKDISRRRRQERELAQAREQLQALGERRAIDIEAERLALARALHDEIGQTLTALKLTLVAACGRCNDGRGNPLHDQAVAMADDMLAAIRAMAYRLRPPQLDDLGLAAALRWHLHRLGGERTPAFRISEDLGDLPLPKEVELGGFRIAQEAIANVIRHAGASAIELTLVVAAGTLRITIADDGAGFDPEAAFAHGSLGLLGMRERARALGGALRIESRPGAGCRVVASLPLAIPSA